MTKIAGFTASLLVLVLASAASLPAEASAQAGAQTYYPGYPEASGGSCTNISRDLSIGSRSDDVRQLQSFIVAQNYPGGGSWMVTGYFGQATATGVRNFQQTRGLPMTSVADAATRAAIRDVSCGGAVMPPVVPPTPPPGSYWNWNTYAPPPPTPISSPPVNIPPYPYTYNFGTCGTFPLYYPCTTSYSSVTLTSLSPMSGAPGTLVTVYGTGFESANNTVYIGGTTLRNIPSYNGVSLTFAIPSTLSGPVSVSVGNARNVSNALTFVVVGGTLSVGCGYPYGYGYNCPPPMGPISISFLSPNSGAVGKVVAVYGRGFSAEGNSVRFGNGVIANLRSFDGTSISFTVPSQISGYGYQPIGLGTYDVSVTNSAGQRSNTLPFTITSLGPTAGAPSITNVSGPTTLVIGATGTWTVSLNTIGNTYTSMSVRWGDENLGYSAPAPQSMYVSGTQTFTFTHVYYQTGTYTITFTASNPSTSSGQSNSATATVSVTAGTTGNVTLTTVSPQSGAVGTQVVLTGTGFTADNAVHFGIGGTRHAYSANGTTIYFTIPFYVSPCDLIGPGCAAPAQQVLPGSYPIYISNSNGTTGTITFTVQ